MNEEDIKNGIELLKKAVDDNNKISEHCYYFDEYQMNRLRQETFKLADALNQEKEKNKKLEDKAILLRKTHNYDVKIIDDVKGEAVELYRVIDMMAEEILKITKANDISNYLKQFSNYDIDFIKQYYFKKARGEK